MDSGYETTQKSHLNTCYVFVMTSDASETSFSRVKPTSLSVSHLQQVTFQRPLECYSHCTWAAEAAGHETHGDLGQLCTCPWCINLVLICLICIACSYWLVSHTRSVIYPSQNCPSHQPPSTLVKELLWVGTPLVSSHAQRLKGQRATLYGHDVSGLIKGKTGCRGTGRYDTGIYHTIDGRHPSNMFWLVIHPCTICWIFNISGCLLEFFRQQ